MAAKIKSGLEISKKDLQTLSIPFLLVFVLAVLLFVSYKILFPRIQNEKSDLAKNKQDEQVLTKKQQVLSSFSSEASSYVGSSVVAVPEKNSALIMISQIKKIVQVRLLAMNNLQIGSLVPEKNGLYKVQLQFDLDGDLLQSTAFIKDVENVAPIANINKIKVSQTSGTSRMTVSINVYSAPYPKTLPAITEAESDFTDKEKATLAKLTNLVQPAFSEVTPNSPQQRPNPFE